MWRPTRNGEADVLIDECRAVLAGRYVEHLQRLGDAIPDWAWTNALTHASESRLRAIIKERPHRGPRSRLPWQEARAYLASELLDAAARSGSLETLQRKLLVPLELELMTINRRCYPRPSEWVARVLAALSKSPRPQRPARDDSL